jgi:hypothetical protein
VGQRLRRGHGRPDLGPGLCLRALVGEIAVNAADALRADIASGYDTWRTIFQSGLSTMKARGELRDGADPRHLAAAPIIAHQGSAGLSQLVGPRLRSARRWPPRWPTSARSSRTSPGAQVFERG